MSNSATTPTLALIDALPADTRESLERLIGMIHNEGLPVRAQRAMASLYLATLTGSTDRPGAEGVERWAVRSGWYFVAAAKLSDAPLDPRWCSDHAVGEKGDVLHAGVPVEVALSEKSADRRLNGEDGEGFDALSVRAMSYETGDGRPNLVTDAPQVALYADERHVVELCVKDARALARAIERVADEIDRRNGGS